MSSSHPIIVDLVAQACRIERERVKLDATLKDLDLSSLDAVRLLFEIEDHFDVSVPEREDRYAAATVRDLIAGVDQLLAAKAKAG